MENQITYTLQQLKNLNDDQIFLELKKIWGYKENESLRVIGQINRKSNFSQIYTLSNLKDSKGNSLLYPLENFKEDHGCFIGLSLPNTVEIGQWVQATLKLAPKKEREKHSNPFELNVQISSLKKLVEIPSKVIEDGIHDDLIENWVIEYFAEKNAEEITEKNKSVLMQHEILLKKEEELGKNLKSLEKKEISFLDKLAKNQEKIELCKLELEENKELVNAEKVELKKNKDLIIQAQAELISLKHQKEEILNKLNNFIEEKVNILRELEIIDEDSLHKLIGKNNTPVQLETHYLLGKDIKDIEEVIKHIQAYLYNKGIMYRRNILENFYTLLSTRDLIILAGDSGAGKTNLVKSFAEATGGKHYIIPVKPNWTSSEDLLGYYNPVEQNYLSTPFLTALIDAKNNPQVPHFICLDEMNLARVEYYFADFLSLLEERNTIPNIPLYSQSESSHLINEAKNFLALIDEAKNNLNKNNITDFIEILKDESLNTKLHNLCGFKDGDSLLKYHTRLRKSFDNYINNPAEIELPNNVFFIGAINIDETTHYLSPKILDRAHIIRFSNPLLQNWEEIEKEVEEYNTSSNRDIEKPVFLSEDNYNIRAPYPKFDKDEAITKKLLEITKDYLIPLGIEFGLRTIRQSVNYAELYKKNFDNFTDSEAFNNIIRQKILPKLMFDGMKNLTQTETKSDKLWALHSYISKNLEGINLNNLDDCRIELKQTLSLAEANDWVVNYWSK